MRLPVTLFSAFIVLAVTATAQPTKELNTAVNCSYLLPEEKAMIYEINLLRSNPKNYLPFITPLLVRAEQLLKNEGRGRAEYSITVYTTTSGYKTMKRIDTIWHYANEEKVKALRLLVKELNTLAPIQILQPSIGVYTAAKKHAADQEQHQWQLLHTGSDGSKPWNRICTYDTAMLTGNENIAGHSYTATARDVVIILLVDEGIPGYGHRYNMLNPKWTHVGCVYAGNRLGMSRWIQNFGQRKTK